MRHNPSFTHHTALCSPLHRADARVKCVIALAYVIALTTTPPQSLLAFVIYAGLLLWTIALARVPVLYIAARAAAVLPFSVLIAVGLPFIADGKTVSLLGLNISIAGLWMLASVTIKATLCAAVMVLLTAVTSREALLDALRRLGVPVFFLDILTMTLRYLSLLGEEANRFMTAAKARGYAPRHLPQATIIGRLIGHLFIRSLERAERVYGAMRLRGYNGTMPAPPAPPLSVRQGTGLASALLLLVILRVFVA